MNRILVIAACFCGATASHAGDLLALPDSSGNSGELQWQAVPEGLLFNSYIAGPKEPRFSTAAVYDQRRGRWLWDATVGARVGIVRYGTKGSRGAEGWQFDMEGAGMPRLDPGRSMDIESADYRFGALLTHARGNLSTKFGYFHVSSHVGDEFLLRNPDYQRRNFVQESIVLGSRWRLDDTAAVYAEAAYAFVTRGGADPWQFQFGAEYTHSDVLTARGGPFAATNFHLRQELNYTPAISTLAGWQWTGVESGHSFRLGLQYYSGPTSQVQFLNRRDHLIGIGTWYDF